jgi:hypothetical protein
MQLATNSRLSGAKSLLTALDRSQRRSGELQPKPHQTALLLQPQQYKPDQNHSVGSVVKPARSGFVFGPIIEYSDRGSYSSTEPYNAAP